MSNILPIIIVNYQNPSNTLECLESIAKEEDLNLIKPVVVDVGKNSGKASALAKKIIGRWSEIDYLPLKKNLGFSGANNYGLRFSLEKYQPESVALLNDDTVIGERALTQLNQYLLNQKKIAAVSPKILFYPGKEFHKGYRQNEIGQVIWYAGGAIDWREVVGFHIGVDEVDRGQYDQTRTTDFFTGCSVVLKTSALQEVGLFDDKYFLYLEDLDLSVRLKKAGWDIKYYPEAKVWHKNAGSSGSGSKLHMYYQTRNKFLFGEKYAPWRTKLFLLKNLLVGYSSASVAGRLARRDYILRRYGHQSKVH